MTAKEYELITRARKRYIRWERCHFVTLFGTFWYLVSKKSHNHSVIIHLWRLWRSKTVEICKIHRKLMIFKSQYCFANIFVTKAPFFMKFQNYIHKILKTIHKDRCTHRGTQGLIVRQRILSRRNARAHIYASCARGCAWIFTKNHLIILYYLINISFKFHKDRSFRCRDICKTILTFKNHKFLMYFAYIHSFSPPKSSKMDNYWITIKTFGNKISKCTYLMNKKTPVPAHRLLCSPINKQIVFDSF